MEKNSQITVENLVTILKRNLVWIAIAGVVMGCIAGVCGQLFIEDEYTSSMEVILDIKDALGTDVGMLDTHTAITVEYLSAPKFVTRVVEEAGIRVHTIPSAELSRGRGGPRCMSMPLWREDPN